jgi:pimeloyl-ACP methyl ester carboxylesterase
MRYADGYWWSNDGLRLHYRDYPGPPDRPTILCLPGLTRNARDYASLAERLSPRWRVIAVEFRGRGESAFAKDPMTYVPLTYVQDVEGLLAELELETVILIGTSLGGIVAMLLAATGRERVAAMVLNDIGPVIETAGLDRIKSYVGRAGSWPTWVHAARALSDSTQHVYPDYGLEDWLAMAKRLYRLTAQGRVVPDYDKGISEPFRLPGGEAGVDLWPTLSALSDVPTLIVRGELSDILSADTADAVARKLPKSTSITVPRVGHAPTLDEPEAVAGIEALLAQL